MDVNYEIGSSDAVIPVTPRLCYQICDDNAEVCAGFVWYRGTCYIKSTMTPETKAVGQTGYLAFTKGKISLVFIIIICEILITCLLSIIIIICHSYRIFICYNIYLYSLDLPSPGCTSPRK